MSSTGTGPTSTTGGVPGGAVPTLGRVSVGSRLWAAGTAFALGFALANVGILVIPSPDRALWLLVAAVLMLTGAVGVLAADTSRRLSLWAVVGVELLVVVVGVPVLWVVSVAGSTDGVPTSVVPTDLDLGAALDVVQARAGAIARSAALAALATVLALALTVPAALRIVRTRPRLGALVRRLGVVVLLAPLVTLLVPWSTQLGRLGLTTSPWSALVGLLLLAVPLALWLSVAAAHHVPWRRLDAVKADGATRAQQLRRFTLPEIGPWAVVVGLLVLVVVAQDALAGYVLVAVDDERPVPATLLAAEPRVAAVLTLVWAVPALVVLALTSRRLLTLLGRTDR